MALTTKPLRILVLGASGMLGNAVFRYFFNKKDYYVYGTVRSDNALKHFTLQQQSNIIKGVDLTTSDALIKLYSEVRPNIVINCVGVVKQLEDANDTLITIPVNTLLPHRLARVGDLYGAKLIHISTDCVFSGKEGYYTENDIPDAKDLYGISKHLGEVIYSNTVVLRTSIIGHELNTSHSLVNWFLSQEGKVKGFTKAIFSGLPTVELARVIEEYVLPNKKLEGLYHVSSLPINKFDLLNLIKKQYNKDITIEESDSLVIDRSLNSSKFRTATGYNPPSWPDLVKLMCQSK